MSFCSFIEEVYGGSEICLEAIDWASIVVALVCDNEDKIVGDVADLLSRLVNISVPEPCEREFVAEVGHKGTQIVQLAESVLNDSTAAAG